MPWADVLPWMALYVPWTAVQSKKTKGQSSRPCTPASVGSAGRHSHAAVSLGNWELTAAVGLWDVTLHWSPSILEPHFVSILNKGSQTTSAAFRLCFGNEIIFTKDQNLGIRSRLKRSGGHHLWQPSLCQDLGGFHPAELAPRPDPRTGSPNLQRALAPGLDQGLWGTSVPLLCGGPDLGLQGASVPLLCGGLDTGPQGASVPLLCEGRQWGPDTGLAPLDACLLFQRRGVTLALLTGGVVIVWGGVRHGG